MPARKKHGLMKSNQFLLVYLPMGVAQTGFFKSGTAG